jgi:hypothetical protein
MKKKRIRLVLLFTLIVVNIVLWPKVIGNLSDDNESNGTEEESSFENEPLNDSTDDDKAGQEFKIIEIE